MEFIAVISILFTGLYFILSADNNCWYRRYILPSMFLVLAFFYLDDSSGILFAISGLFSYLGQRGYGQQMLLEEKKLKENNVENNVENNAEKVEEVK